MTAPRQTESCPQHGDYYSLVRTFKINDTVWGVYHCPSGGGHDFSVTPDTLHPDERNLPASIAKARRLDALTPEELKQEARDAYATALKLTE